MFSEPRIAAPIEAVPKPLDDLLDRLGMTGFAKVRQPQFKAQADRLAP